MLVKASELRLLDVINISDGRRLGNVIDMETTPHRRNQSYYSPGPGRFLCSSIGEATGHSPVGHREDRC